MSTGSIMVAKFNREICTVCIRKKIKQSSSTTMLFDVKLWPQSPLIPGRDCNFSCINTNLYMIRKYENKVLCTYLNIIEYVLIHVNWYLR